MFLNKYVDLKDLRFSKENFLKFFVDTNKHKAPSQTLLTKQSHFYFDNESEEANRMSVSMHIYNHENHENEINLMTRTNGSPKSLTNLEDQVKKTNMTTVREKFSVHKKIGKLRLFCLYLFIHNFYLNILHALKY